ncbi:MAG TPA: histone deacetylase, partial [Bacillota bacterium]|nr:histone deacetylase [Bacillota bacterium]
YKPRLASLKDVARTHICIPDVEAKVGEADLVAAGAGLLLADSLMNQEINNGFSLVRPPGHHAMRVVHGNRGFCNINNMAIMTDYLRARHKVRKIAIVDTDVHHGDGSQDIFYHDPDVLYISFHQDGRTLYPGTGFTDEMGGPNAYGTTINIPLPPGTSDEGLTYVLDHLVMPILQDFQPDLILNSAGQDNHYSDPLGSMKISAQGYARLNTKLAPDLAVLEGGYAVESALPYVNLGIILAMAGLDYSFVREPDYDVGKLRQDCRISEYIAQLVDLIMDNWKNRAKGFPREFKLVDGFYQRQKSIFYDTDYIDEKQTERIAACKDCAGVYEVVTQAVRSGWNSGRGKALVIPFQACPACQELGAKLYADAKSESGWDNLYLSDKVNDRYFTYNARLGQEREY